VLIAIFSMTVLCTLFGLGLGWAARKLQVESNPVVERIEAILPQTQCGQCN
jgi:electron transport complex protein RnfB